MRYVKPLKGFRLSKNLGILLFSTAVLSGQLGTLDKAYGLEAPKIPPSVMLASAKTDNPETKVSEVKEKDKKVVSKEKDKAAELVNKSSSDISKSVIKKDDAIKSEPVKEEETKSQNLVSESSNEEEFSIKKPILPVSIRPQDIPVVEDDEEDDDEDFAVSKKKDEVKPETKPVVKPEVKVETKTEVKAEIKKETKPVVETKAKEIEPKKNDVIKKVVKEEKVSSKPLTVPTVKSIEKTSETKVSSAPKAKDSLVKDNDLNASSKKVSVKSKKVNRKYVKEDNVCPPEWDWFSAPLVFVKDANGKMVIRADRNAPKIVIGGKKVEDNHNTIKVVEPKPVVKVKKASANVKKQQNKAEVPQYVEAKPIEAPAVNVVTIEPKAVEEHKEERVIQPKPVVRLVDKPQNQSKPMFAEASAKMARIKRLHSLDQDDNINISEQSRPRSMVRLNKFVSELINRAEKRETYKKEQIMAKKITPQAPPVESKVASNSNNNNNDSYKNTGTKYAFRPYVSAESFYLRHGASLRYRN